MSSSSQISIRPVHTVRVTDQQSIDVNAVLGPRGMTVLRETLNALTAEGAQDGSEAAVWQKAGADRYVTSVRGRDVALILGDNVARVVLASEMEVHERYQANLDPGDWPAVHGAINQVLARSAASLIEARMSNYVAVRGRQKATVTNRVTNQNVTRITARMRLRVGAR